MIDWINIIELLRAEIDTGSYTDAQINSFTKEQLCQFADIPADTVIPTDIRTGLDRRMLEVNKQRKRNELEALLVEKFGAIPYVQANWPDFELKLNKDGTGFRVLFEAPVYDEEE